MLRYICENENRLWGCDDTTIYASKLGDPFNWNVYEGLDTDSYAVDTGSAGKFTGCVSFLGYPIFFKEDHIYKVYGSLPSNFEIMGSATLGVADGSGRSLAIAGETLFYLSRAGIMVYSGGIPQPIGSAFGMDRFKNAVGGSDGLKYYVSMTGPDGELLYVYDTQKGLWHTEDATKARYFARFGGNLFLLNDQGEVWIAGNVQNAPESTEEETVAWSAEFGDFTENDPNKKGVSKLQLRMELEEGAEVQVYLKFDGGEWLKVDEKLCEAKKRSYYLPIVPRRGDHSPAEAGGQGHLPALLPDAGVLQRIGIKIHTREELSDGIHLRRLRESGESVGPDGAVLAGRPQSGAEVSGVRAERAESEEGLQQRRDRGAAASRQSGGERAAQELRQLFRRSGRRQLPPGEQAEPAGGRPARSDRQLRLVLLRRGADLRERLRAAAEGSAGPHPEPRGLLVEQGDGPAMEQLQEELSA